MCQSIQVQSIMRHRVCLYTWEDTRCGNLQPKEDNYVVSILSRATLQCSVWDLCCTNPGGLKSLLCTS